MLFYAKPIFRRKMNNIIVKCILPILLILPIIYFTVIYFDDGLDLLRGDKSLPSRNRNATILTSSTNGRVGNVLSAYASLMYFQKFGFDVVMNEWQLNQTYKIFKREKLVILPREVELKPNESWEGVGMTDMSMGFLTPSDNFLINMEDYKFNRFLDIGAYPAFLWLFKDIISELREQFIFQDHLLDHVRQWKEQIYNQLQIEKNIIYIGVHCRRTDFANHYRIVNHGELIDRRHFDKAFEVFRSRHNDENNKVIFLAVSDDTAWIKDNFSNQSDVRYGSDYSSINEDLVGFDLCVLGSSQHTVITYGTFGMWGALLSGGEVIAAKGTNNLTYSEEDVRFLRARMPGWSYVDTRDSNNSKLLSRIDE